LIKSLVKSLSPNQAQGRIDDGKPIAVLDIGSNSVRLVVYERHVRALTPIYNEKVACGLGRGVGQTGALAQESVDRALVAMRRFALVCKITHVETIHILATAATRDASNGAMFIEAVEEIMSAPVRILSGEEEAYFAALGTLAGMPTQNGLLGDFGGGSLEIALLEDAKVVSGETHALGAIRLQDDSDKSVARAYELAKERLSASNLIKTRAWPEFVAIGGTWRAIAKVHQQMINYPLTMVQGYRVSAEEMISLCNKIMKAAEAGESLDDAQRLSSNRKDLLGYGAAALKATLEMGKFASVKFSALGVREGYLFDQLPLSARGADPLLQACEELSILRSRSPEHAADLIDFTDRFIAAFGFDESVTQKRLRHAACYLGDIAWRGHPDYRGAQAVDSAAFGAFVGVDHSGRAHLARLLAVRYAGLKRKHVSNDDIFDLCKPKHAFHADMIGALFRVAYLFSAAMPGVLPLIQWAKTETGIEIRLPNGMELLAAEKTVRRVEQLAAFIEAEISIVTQ
jgi:exopolyphosphatase/guanosine-5'-triphosphate,3'-diphosphate pyrophosphatase